MIKREITPISEITTRAPEAGRIRLGIQVPNTNPNAKSKTKPQSINTLRFTSTDKPIIEQIAARYGGTVREWNEPKARNSHQWQVITESAEVEVMLIPDGLTTYYEHWVQSGCQRRCDGITVSVPVKTHGDYEIVDEPCLCRIEGAMLCKVTTRIQVVLPEFSFLGTWRLETKGWNAAAELPGMYALISEAAVQGRMIEAVLSVERREEQTPRGKNNFVVPRLAVRNTVHELMAGTSTPALSGPTMPALAAGDPDEQRRTEYPTSTPMDDDIVDAEIIDPEELEVEALLRADATNYGIQPDAYVAAVRGTAKDDDVVGHMRKCSVAVRAGKIEPLGLKQGRVDWQVN